MPRFIKVTGILEIDDDEFDPGPRGPLTAEAHERYTTRTRTSLPPRLDDLEDLEFEVEEE